MSLLIFLFQPFGFIFSQSVDVSVNVLVDVFVKESVDATFFLSLSLSLF